MNETVIGSILGGVLPVLLDLAGLVLAAALTRAALWAQRRLGIEIEARHREALHQAVMTGLESALAAGAAGREVAVAMAAAHARASVPDAIRALKPGDDVLRRLAEAKLQHIGGRGSAS